MDRKAIFFDRDGVINKVVVDNGKPYSPRKIDDFAIFLEAKECLSSSRDLGFLNIIITNQPDIARNLLDKDELEAMHKIIEEELPVDDIMLCSHDNDDNCSCRKPKPGLIIDAAKTWSINCASSFVIGDTWRDMEAGKAVGCRTVLLNKSYNQDCRQSCDFRVDNLKEAVELIKNKES